jgi:hypothetical protein
MNWSVNLLSAGRGASLGANAWQSDPDARARSPQTSCSPVASDAEARGRSHCASVKLASASKFDSGGSTKRRVLVLSDAIVRKYEADARRVYPVF